MRLHYFISISVCLLMLCALDRSAQGQTYTVLHSFQCSPDGASPVGDFIADGADNIYGATSSGGTTGWGTVFQMTPDGTVTVLYSFTGGSDGGAPLGGVVRDSIGNLYGTTWLRGSTLTCFDGEGEGCGTVFKVSPDGTFTLLHSFSERSDGAFPQAGLTMGTAGNLYGTTMAGGVGDVGGIVFEISSDGTRYKTFFDFNGSPTGRSLSPLLRDHAGNLYGMGSQSVFELDSAGTLTILHEFPASQDDGFFPVGGVIRDGAGNFYGTTDFGGSGNSANCFYGGYGCGTVFKLDPSGNETVLYNFAGKRDGGTPYAGLVMDAKGNLFGTTQTGGSRLCENGSCGTIFELSPTGKKRVLHYFAGPPTDGDEPIGAMVYLAGSLYGTTPQGGTNNCGTIFKYTP